MKRSWMAAFLVLLGGCSSMPTGPNVLTLPGTGKGFDQFRADEASCRDYAMAQLGGRTGQQAADESMAHSAVLGATVGAVAGGAMDGSRGAAVGAGMGAVAGTVAGAGMGAESSYVLQRRYDNAYIQCMYARGHRVPVTGEFTGGRPVPLPPAGKPPPPPGQ